MPPTRAVSLRQWPGCGKTFATGRTRDIEWRKNQLLQLAKLVEENEPAIAAALAEDLDRNPVEAFIADIATTAGEAKFAAKKLRKWTRRKHLLLEAPQLPGRGWVEYEPYGTVLIIGAWNYPILPDAGSRGRRHRRRQRRHPQAVGNRPGVVPVDGRVGAEIPGQRRDRGRSRATGW